MARPPLALGTWGNIATGTKGGSCYARALYRAKNGVTSRPERWASTEPKAKRKLEDYLNSLSGTDAKLTTTSRFKLVAAAWLKEVREEQLGTTYDKHKSILTARVLPEFAELQIHEIKTSMITRFLKAMYKQGYSTSTRSGAKTVIRAVFQWAIDNELISANPARELGRLAPGKPKMARAFEPDELGDFLAKLDADKHAPGTDLPDLIRFLFGTGVRIGEALGLRWRDVNLSDKPIKVTAVVAGVEVVQVIEPWSAWINGNVVYESDNGVVRHDGKTEASNGVIELPDFLRTLLAVRCPADVAPLEPVFPGRDLSWRNPRNVGRAIRRLRARIGYPDFTSHWGRKTVGAAMDQAGQNARKIADQLRQSSIATTQQFYIARRRKNPEAAQAINAMMQPQEKSAS